MQTTGCVTVRLLDSVSALAGEGPAWQRLADRMSQPFLSTDYLLSAIEAFHAGDPLRVVVLDAGSELAAAAPLVLVRRNLHRSLELAGTSVLMDPAGFLYDSPASLDTLAQAVAGLGYPIHLRGVQSEGETLRALSRTVRHDGGVVVPHHSRVATHVPIRGPWAGYHASLPPKMRQDLRRFHSRATAIGSPVFEWVTPSPDDTDRWLAAFMELESTGWKAREAASLARAAPPRRFYGALAARAAARGTLRVATLRIAGDLVAMLYALQACNRLWLLKMAYDERVARVSPGVLLMRFVLQMGHDLKLGAVEFLGEDAAWQQRWRPVARTYTSALVVPLTARGLVGLGLNAALTAPRHLLGLSRTWRARWRSGRRWRLD